MKQYQLFVRLSVLEGWQYAMTCTTPALAWQGMMLARARGCVCKIMPTLPVVERKPDVLAHV